MKKYRGIFGLLGFTIICSIFNEIGTPFWLSFVLMILWPISAFVILYYQVPNMRKGMEYLRIKATNAELFVGICYIGCAVMWLAVIFGLAFVFPNDFVIWDSAVSSEGSILWRIFSHSLHSLLFGLGLMVFFGLFCSLLHLPFYLLGRNLFPDQYKYVRFPNIWLDYCALPLSLFTYISQMIGAADYYYVIEYFLSLM